MRKLLFTVLLAAALCATAQDEAVVAKPVKYTCVFSEPDAEGLSGNGIWGNGTGCQIDYLVTLDGITEIDSKSLTVFSLTTRDGKTLPKDYRGRGSKWSKGQGIEVANTGSRNGKGDTTISIFVPTEEPLTVPVINGTINAKVGGETATQTLTFKTADNGAKQEAGPFTFAVGVDAGDNDFKRLHDAGFPFAISITGDRNQIKSLTIEDADGKALQNRGTSSYSVGKGKPKTTYNYSSAPTTPEFFITVTYFTDLREVPITFGQIDAKPENIEKQRPPEFFW